jgi:cyclic beta-1,2-glucan synthetase
LNRAIVKAAFLPHQAYLSADAIVRVLYRLLISKRHLLEWQTAEVSHQAARLHLDPSRATFLPDLRGRRCVYVVAGTSGHLWRPAWAAFLALWVAAPAVQHWIRAQRGLSGRRNGLKSRTSASLRRIARETWRYFDDLVGPEHNWLPPDNSQEALRVEIADRTSPTNIGLWLMSAVAARDLGYLTPELMVDRCTATIETLEKLESCEGHLLNWYNTRTLEPLPPKYVSTVDSGNLIASLWVLKQAA